MRAYSNMTGTLIRGISKHTHTHIHKKKKKKHQVKTQIKGRWPPEDKGNDWSNVVKGQEMPRLLEVGRCKEFSPWDAGGSRSPANTLSSIPQNCKRMHSYCFQPVSWDYFVTAALRNLSRFFQKKKNVIQSQINRESGQADKKHTHLCPSVTFLAFLFHYTYTELPPSAAQALWSLSQTGCPPGPGPGSASDQGFQTGQPSWWFLGWCPING